MTPPHLLLLIRVLLPQPLSWPSMLLQPLPHALQPLLADSQLPAVTPPHLLLASQQPRLPFPLASTWLLLLLLVLCVLLPQPLP